MDESTALYYDELSRSHFWLTSKYCVIERFVRQVLAGKPSPKRVLEIGSNTGQFLSRFLSDTEEAYGMDLRHNVLKISRSRYPQISPMVADGRRLPFPDGKFDLILILDVLEHIPDDMGALREIHRVLAPGGTLIVCVPAYQWLYGHHDKLFGHVRRYTRGQLLRRMRRAGMVINRATYFQSPFLLPLWIKRKFGRGEGDDFIVPHPYVNAFFDWFLRQESLVIRAFDIPFGPTLLTAAHKPTFVGLRGATL